MRGTLAPDRGSAARGTRRARPRARPASLLCREGPAIRARAESAAKRNAGGRRLGGHAALHWHRRILLLLIALGLLSGLPDLRARLAAEQANHRVELVADQGAFTQLALRDGVPAVTVFKRLKALGVVGLGVPEESLASLQQAGVAAVMSGAQWSAVRQAVGRPLGRGPVIDPTGTYALVPAADRGLVRFIAAGLTAGLGPRLTVSQQLVAREIAISVALPPSAVLTVPLGFRPQSFSLARASGLDVVPRPAGTPAGYSGAGLRRLFAALAAAGVPVHTVLFAGASTRAIPGDPNHLATLGRILLGAGWNLGVLANASGAGNVDQPGTRRLSTSVLSGHTVRVYSVSAASAERPAGPLVASLVRRVERHNLRILYLHPGLHPGLHPDAQADAPVLPHPAAAGHLGPQRLRRAMALYARLAAALRARGFSLGPPRPLPAIRVTTAQRVLQGLAVVAATLLLLDVLLPALGRYGYRPLVVLGGLTTLLAVAAPTLTVQWGAVAAGSVFGGLALCHLARVWVHPPGMAPEPPGTSFGRVWRRALARALTVSAITFAGALLVATLLGDTLHMLAWVSWSGLRLTALLLPLLALAGGGVYAGFGGPGAAGLRGQARWLGAQPVRYRDVAMCLALAVTALWWAGGGHALASRLPGALVPARPAAAAIIGYASLFLAVFCAERRRRRAFLLCLAGAAVSQVGLVDAFSRLPMPFWLSVGREARDLAAGVLAGTAALAAVWWGARLGGQAPGGG